MAERLSLAARAARFALRVGRVLSPDVAWWLGGVVGDAFGALPMRDQGRARAHLTRAFPERPPAWIRRTARACFRHAGAMALWTLATLHRDPRALRRTLACEGRRHWAWLRAAGRRGEGVVGVSGHLGNWELLARVGGTWSPLTVIGRRLRDPGLDAIIAGMRGHGGSRVIYQDEGARAVLRALRDGRLIATLPDQDVPRLASVFVPWFGIPAATPVGPAQLAAMARVAAQPIFIVRRGGRWCLHCGAPIRAPSGLARDDAALWLTAYAMAYEEVLVRRFPAQWVWWHKRWRRSPPPTV